MRNNVHVALSSVSAFAHAATPILKISIAWRRYPGAEVPSQIIKALPWYVAAGAKFMSMLTWP